jgi:hypothetical protein
MPHDPGPTIRLQLTPISSLQAPVTTAYVQAAPQPEYVIRPSIGFGYSNYRR